MSEDFKNLIFEQLKNIVGKRIREKQWKSLFVDTGELLTSHMNSEAAFQADLQGLFSEENMRALAEKTEGTSGYELIRKIKTSLQKLMMQYELSELETETYIDHFIQQIISYIRETDPQKAQEIFISDGFNRITQEHMELHKKLETLEKLLRDLQKEQFEPCTIYTIEQRIVRTAQRPELDLTFFELDDAEFETQFNESIDREVIHIIGPSREETLYRVLSEIKKKYDNRLTLIVERQEDWQKLEEQKTQNCILIPTFYSGEVTPISGNTNIFIYHTYEPCYGRDKLELHRRTRNNLRNALEKLGCDHREAYQLIESTNGIWASLKKRLFKTVERGKQLPWVTKHDRTVLAALLCGKWTEQEGDKSIFEALTGQPYLACMEEIKELSQSENPFTIRVRHFGTDYMQLASPEDAWAELGMYITPEMLDPFMQLFQEVMKEKDLNREETFRLQLKKMKGEMEEGPRYSKTIKEGMLQTLIMIPAFKSERVYQQKVDYTVEMLLGEITDTAQWNYLAPYFPELCEASPDAVIARLESEIKNPTGMKELFSNNTGAIFGENRYVSILWAAEQLIQQKEYAERAFRWLWDVDSFNIEYRSGNSPRELLSLALCAWLNVTAIQGEAKIKAAKDAIRRYPNAWDIICNELPGDKSAKMVSLSTPKYREIVPKEDVFSVELLNCYHEYLNICLENIGDRAERWCTILEKLTYYDRNYVQKALNQLAVSSNEMDDAGRTVVNEEIKKIIHKHRYFSDSSWSASEEVIGIFEDTLLRIKTENPVFNYLYLFLPKFNFPILHPVPYAKDDFQGSKSINDEKMEQEITEQVERFQAQGLCVEELIKIALEHDRYKALGENLAIYFCNNQYDEAVFSTLLREDRNGYQLYRYTGTLIYRGLINLETIVSKVKCENYKPELVAKLISLQTITNVEDGLIFHENVEIKQAFWKGYYGIKIAKDAGHDTYEMALQECFQYGHMQGYAELLDDIRDRITTEQLYEAFIKIDEVPVGEELNGLSDYHINEILEALQNAYLYDDEKCLNLSRKEWYFGNLLEWDQMKCTQRIVQSDPHLYAYLVSIIYKRDKEGASDPEKQKLANRIYGHFKRMKFCPAEKNGKVDYEELTKWADQYLELLKSQGQEWLWEASMGELLAHSPAGEDGLCPCEAVREWIEEHSSKTLIRAYATEIRNERGVYTPNAGLGERNLARKYKDIAEKLKPNFPHTSEIYYSLHDKYMIEAEQERKEAEDVQ